MTNNNQDELPHGGQTQTDEEHQSRVFRLRSRKLRVEVVEGSNQGRVIELAGHSVTIGSGRVGFVKTVAGGVRVQLRATRGEDLVAAEDRLRAAGLPFEIEREPVWSGNTYLAEIRLPDAPGAGAGPGRPSAFRVAAELNRLLPAGAHAEKVRRLGESYVADVLLLQGDGAGLAESVPRRSTMVARVVLLPPDAQRPPSAGRVERWLMTLKP